MNFTEQLQSTNSFPLLANGSIDTLQCNITYQCNMHCAHCHVGSDPTRTANSEQMSPAVIQHCLDAIEKLNIKTLDITGGAPELHPKFRDFVSAASRMANSGDAALTKIIVRSNASLFSQAKYADIPHFLADNRVEVNVSLPHYTKTKFGKTRNVEFFEDVIAGLQALNAVGYGVQNGVRPPVTSELILNLVSNPPGAFMPQAQEVVEAEFREALSAEYGIEFNHLFNIVNCPVGRFAELLDDRGALNSYVDYLSERFNPATLSSLMCLNQLSVAPDGTLYDCDFNQAARLPVQSTLLNSEPESSSVSEISSSDRPLNIANVPNLQGLQGLTPLLNRHIRTADHCLCCTAGAGSSCGGSLE